jgi:hypothetical protein
LPGKPNDVALRLEVPALVDAWLNVPQAHRWWNSPAKAIFVVERLAVVFLSQFLGGEHGSSSPLAFRLKLGIWVALVITRKQLMKLRLGHERLETDFDSA